VETGMNSKVDKIWRNYLTSSNNFYNFN